MDRTIETPTPIRTEVETGPAPLPVLEELRRAVETDCRVAPEKYLEEVRVAFGGE